MTNVIIKIDKTAALFTDPESEEARLQNLMLNMMGGLEYKDLTVEEKELLHKNGYKPR